MDKFWRLGIDNEQILQDIEDATREAEFMTIRYGQPFKKSPNIMSEIRKLARRGRYEEKDVPVDSE